MTSSRESKVTTLLRFSQQCAQATHAVTPLGRVHLFLARAFRLLWTWTILWARGGRAWGVVRGEEGDLSKIFFIENKQRNVYFGEN